MNAEAELNFILAGSISFDHDGMRITMRPRMNQSRCTRKLGSTLKHYKDNEDCDTATAVVDILTDIRHVCDRYGLSFASVDRIARRHHMVESAQDREAMRP